MEQDIVGITTEVEASFFTANNVYMVLGAVISIMISLVVLIITTNYLPFKYLRKYYWLGISLFILLGLPIFSILNFQGIFIFLNDEGLINRIWTITNYVSFPLNLLKWVLIGTFLKYLELSANLSKRDRILLLIPMINLVFLSKHLLNSEKFKLAPFTMLLIAGAIIFAFYSFVFPILLPLGIDSYGWYMNIIYGVPENFVDQGYANVGYTYWNDLFMHCQASIPFISALLCFPAYFELRRFKA